MIQILGKDLSQWEVGRCVKIETEEDFNEVHFAQIGDSNALVITPNILPNGIFADIPNIHLQDARRLNVYLVNATENAEHTIEKATFSISPREKPSDYIYTETEVKRYEVLEAEIEEVKEAVEQYITSDTEFAKTVQEALQTIMRDYALKSMIPTVPDNVSAFFNDAGYLTTETEEIFVGTVQTTWEELVEAYDAGKFIFIYNNGGFYTLSIYLANNNPPYMKFTTYNASVKGLDALHINGNTKKWEFTRDTVALKNELDANGKGVFIAMYGVTTTSEVLGALSAGKSVLVRYIQDTGVATNDIYAPLYYRNENVDTLIFSVISGKTSYNFRLNSDEWTMQTKSLLDSSDLENYVNKTTYDNDKDKLEQDIEKLQNLTQGIVGGGIGGNDIPAGGRWNLVPNTMLFSFSSQSGKLNLKGTDNGGNAIDVSGCTGFLIFATKPTDGDDTKFNIGGVGFGGTSALTAKLTPVRYFANTDCYIENTSSISAALYRVVIEKKV